MSHKASHRPAVQRKQARPSRGKQAFGQPDSTAVLSQAVKNKDSDSERSKDQRDPNPKSAKVAYLSPAQRKAQQVNEAIKAKMQNLKDQFEPATQAIAKSTGPVFASASPVVLDALNAAAAELEAGQSAHIAVREASRVIGDSPEMLKSLNAAAPAIEATANVFGPSASQVVKVALPLMSDKGITRAILNKSYELGGVSGRRLVGACIRGLYNGGFKGGVIEVSKTAAKIGKTGVKEGGKASPVVGNVVNAIGVGTSAFSLIQTMRDPKATPGLKIAHVLNLVTSVAGCFIPPIGVAGDVALLGAELKAKA